jgi:hypothetical protein
MARKWFYTFDAEDVHKWRFCPRCGSETYYVYDGDYDGLLQCLECPDDDDTTDFTITVKEAR